MNLPHFPSLPRGLKFTDPNAKNELLVYYNKTQEWLKEHEKRLLSFVEFIEKPSTDFAGIMTTHVNIEEYEEKKKALLEPNK